MGSNLAVFLREAGHEVVSVSRSGRNGSLSVDITKPADFSGIDFQPDVVVNAASKLPVSGKTGRDADFVKEVFDTNAVGGVNVANWCVEKKVKKLINCSSLSVIKRPWPTPVSEEESQLPAGPHAAYAMSKLSQEQLMNECVRQNGTQLIHLRISAVYGEGMAREGIIFSFLDFLEKHEELKLTDGETNSLDFIHVKDISRSILEISGKEVHEKLINLASGKPVTVFELAQMLKKITSSNSNIKNTNTEKPPSKSVVEIERLKNCLEGVYDNFIPLDEGLSALIKGKTRSLSEPGKTAL